MSDAIRHQDNSARQSVFAEMQSHFHAASAGKTLPRLDVDSGRIDTALGGGLLCRRVHLITSALSISLASGFSLALAAMLLHAKKASGPIVWCGPQRGGQSGQLFGAGLAEMGLRPEQFIFVREPHPLRRMAACEEAVATDGLAAVIHEYGPLHEKTDLWQTAARRLQRASERGTATTFMIGQMARPSGFESAWHLTPASADGLATTDWRPMWQAQLRHIRGGYPAQARLIWDKSQMRLTTPQTAQDKSKWQAQPYRDVRSSMAHHRWQKSA